VRRTLLDLLEPGTLPAEDEAAVRRYQFRGSSGKVNFALSRLPTFKCLPPARPTTSGAWSASRPASTTSSEAYDDAVDGRFSSRPYVDMGFPSVIDPSVAPPGKHVMACFVQYAPYRLAPEGSWEEQREAFGDAVQNAIAEYAPDIHDCVLHRQVLTPSTSSSASA
jgi:phytoene dehydrogenase-like protein